MEFENIRLYHPSVCKYAALAPTQSRVIFPIEFKTASPNEKARANMYVLSQVHGFFGNPYAPDSDYIGKVFSIDEDGLICQIPSEDGYVAGTTTYYQAIGMLLQENDGVRSIHIDPMQQDKFSDLMMDVVKQMECIWISETYIQG